MNADIYICDRIRKLFFYIPRSIFFPSKFIASLIFISLLQYFSVCFLSTDSMSNMIAAKSSHIFPLDLEMNDTDYLDLHVLRCSDIFQVDFCDLLLVLFYILIG